MAGARQSPTRIQRTAYWLSQGRIIEPVAKGLTYEESRGLEQALIERFGGVGGGQLVNKINGISADSADYQRLLDIGNRILNSLPQFK